MFDYLHIDVSLFYRGIFACITAIFLMLVLGKYFINLVSNYTQPIREDGMSTHLLKKNTPTFGGVLMVFAFLVTVLFWVKFNIFIGAIVFTSIAFAALGFADDFLKLKNKNSNGVSGKLRLVIGFAIGLITAYIFVKHNHANNYSIYFPFVKYFYININGLMYGWIALVIVGTANAVNLTDGLDGLASKILIVVLTTFAILMVGMHIHSIYNGFSGGYNNINYVLQTKLNEVFVIICTLIGVLLGFLWYNEAPAKIFMGDVGSLFLGGTLGAIATVLKQEIVLLVSGLIFVLEAVSVIMQVYYYKATKKRLFLMAPLHHHFEKKGLAETTVVGRFWIVTIIMSLIALLLVRYN